MSDSTANIQSLPSELATVAETLSSGVPMGDLSRFTIEDLTPEEEDKFFQILEDA